MKTSIIVSSFAALCLMITFADAPKQINTYSKNTLATHSLSFTPATSVNEISIYRTSGKKINPMSNSVKMTNDFSYLKFDVAEYMSDNETATEAVVENTFDYLKFNVAEYTDNLNIIENKEIIIAQSDFEYLKFDVNNFVKANDPVTTTALQTDDFSYLKFNVNKYTADSLTETEYSISN